MQAIATDNTNTNANPPQHGYLYVAVGIKYIREAEISARSLKRFSKLPVCLMTDDANYTNDVFDNIIYLQEVAETYGNKILALINSPFQQTVFLDTDTFICSSIDDIFEALELFDMAMVVDNFMHSYGFFTRNCPDYPIGHHIIPEYNTGVMAFAKNNQTTKLLNDWKQLHEEMNVKADMASFREAFLKNAFHVRIVPLPFEYNYHGTHSFGFVYNEVKVIHERLGESWRTLTTMMLPFDKMDRYAKRLNRYSVKRIIIPYVGVIPYTFSPYSIKKKIKKWFGIGLTKKAETYLK